MKNSSRPRGRASRSHSASSSLWPARSAACVCAGQAGGQTGGQARCLSSRGEQRGGTAHIGRQGTLLAPAAAAHNVRPGTGVSSRRQACCVYTVKQCIHNNTMHNNTAHTQATHLLPAVIAFKLDGPLLTLALAARARNTARLHHHAPQRLEGVRSSACCPTLPCCSHTGRHQAAAHGQRLQPQPATDRTLTPPVVSRSRLSHKTQPAAPQATD